MENTAIILVCPQMGENIGATARAMSNFGLVDLRIVNPRDGWPNPKANEMAAHGEFVVKKAQIFEKVKDAIYDINYLVATSANPRYMEKPTSSPKSAFENAQGKLGIMFGCERSGLTNDELNMSDVICRIQTSEINPSLNIAQAVGIMCYELSSESMKEQETNLATKGELEFLMNYLESQLEESGFLQNKSQAPIMKLNIRNMFTRRLLTSQDVKTLMGIFKSFSNKSKL